MGCTVSNEPATDELREKASAIDALHLLDEKESDADDESGYTQSEPNEEWDAIIGDATAADLLRDASLGANEVSDIPTNGCIRRLLFVVNQYESIVREGESPFNFVMALRSYSLVALLNDFLHIRSLYTDNKYGNERSIAFWEHLNASLSETEESEDIYARNNQDLSMIVDESARTSVYGHADTPNVVATQILDTIHCYFYHGEYTDVSNEKNIETYNEKLQWEKKIAVKAQVLNMGAAMNAMETDAKEEDSNDNNNNDEDPNAVEIDGRKFVKKPYDILQFGDPFFYWEYFSANAMYCQPKHASLKEEILNNDIFALSETQFADLEYYTTLVYKSLIGARMTAFNRGGESNAIYEVEPGLPITRAHLMSVVLFDRYEVLSYQYVKRGCNREFTGEGIAAAKARNQDIGHWYRLLRECVLFYGEQTSDQHAYYSSHTHGLLFCDFSPSFNAPLKCTTELAIAQIQCPDNGVVTEYRQHSSLSNPFLDVSFVSRHPYKREKLFSYVSTLEMRDLFQYNVEQNSFESYGDFMVALLIWQNLVSGRLYHHLLDITNQKYQKCLMLMMDNEIAAAAAAKRLAQQQSYAGKVLAEQERLKATTYEGKEENGVPKYIQAIFHFHISNNFGMWIIKSEYQLISPVFANYVLTLEDNSFHKFTVHWNRCIKKAHKKDLEFNFVNEFQFTIEGAQFEKYMALKMDEATKGAELELKLSEESEERYLFTTLCMFQGGNSGHGGFGITLAEIPRSSNVKKIRMEWDLYIPEIGFVLSSASKWLYKTDYTGYQTFPPQLLADQNMITFHVCLKIKESQQ